MVAHLLRLRFDLLLGALQREQRTRSLVALAATAVVTFLVIRGVLSLIDVRTTVAGAIITLGSAAVFLAFFLAPILTGARDPLDPRQFRVFGVDERRTPAQLALAGLISIPSLALLAVTVASAAVAIAHGTPWVLAVLLGVMTFGSTVLAARIGMGVSAILLPERRPRELTTLFALGTTVVAFPLAAYLASREWRGGIPETVAAATQALGFTPLAPTAASAFAFASGQTPVAWLSALVAAVTLAGLWALWTWVARRLLTSAERPTTVRERAGLGWFAVLPANAFGAIAARSLIYWLRDRRYVVNLLVVPIAGVLAALPLRVAGVPPELTLVVPVLVMALFFGWLPHNDVAYDSTAFWVHVASGVGGFADRLGRLVPVVLVAVPALAVAVSITLAVGDVWSLLPALAGTTACLFLSGLGLSSLVSALAPYAVSRPGDSPFQQPQRSSGHGSAGHAVALLGTLAVSIPSLWLLYREITGGRLSVETLWAGLGVGVGVFLLGIVLGAIAFRLRSERLMEFVEMN